jgi:hypothetical protein
MSIVSKPTTDAYRSGWDATFGKRAAAQPRDPSQVINAVLRCVPAQRSELRRKLVCLLEKAPYAPPEDKYPIWIQLKRILEAELSTPPQLYWEQQISDIVEG